MPAVFTREMGVTHADFLRTLPKALDGIPFYITGATITVQDGPRRLTIRLGPEQERRIARLRLPATLVHFEFLDYHQVEIAAFMRRFERCFQRGGG
jgi:hypothetical protein